MEVEFSKIKQAVQSSIPLTIKTVSLPRETESQIEEVLGMFLRVMGQGKLKDSLFYCIRELTVNAKKANTKRVFFEDEGLNINNSTDYSQGMKKFKSHTLDHIQYYLTKQKEAGLYIKVVFHTKENKLHIYVINNSKINSVEEKRIHERLVKSRTLNSMEDALTTVIDDSEGAGLGIIIIILMLKKLGFDENSFNIQSDNEKTVAHIVITMDIAHLKLVETISTKIVNHIEKIPQFPEHLATLQSELRDSNIEFSTIARRISTDLVLTAELLKFVNSAAFMLPKHTDNIKEAVKIVGLNGIRNLIYYHGAYSTLDPNFEKAQELTAHSHRTAIYAYIIARSILKNKAILDSVYVAGMLHDIGKLVLDAEYPKLTNLIKATIKKKEMSSHYFEDLVTGIDHAEIGAKIAENWSFPQTLIDCIRYHHNPAKAPVKSREHVLTICLANVLVNIDEKLLNYHQINRDIMHFFNITSVEMLKNLHEDLIRKLANEENSL